MLNKSILIDKWPDFKPGDYDPFAHGKGFYLNKDVGNRAIGFFHDCLSHCIGPLKGQPFILELWQQAIIGHLFGWLSIEDDRRRYRECLIYIPRKNGKSLLGAGIALHELYRGDKNTPQIVCCAADRDQARELFDVSKMMVLQEEELKIRSEVYKNTIKYPLIDGHFKVISSEASTKHGGNLSCFVADELHALRGESGRDLVDVLQTSTGARTEPLMMLLTTASFDKFSVCAEKLAYAERVRDGKGNDNRFFPVIYKLADGSDWTDPEVWKSCNPNLDVSISSEYLARECERAKETPIYENTFRRLHLNQWTEQESRFLQMAKYEACVGKLPDLTGRACYAGLDLASTTDLSAFVLCFLPETEDEPYYIVPYCWCPADSIKERSQRDRVPYLLWKNQGFIEATPGAVINYDFILSRVDQVAQKYDLRAILFDRWGSTKIIQEIENQGMEVISFGQGYKSMSPPTKELIKLILEKKIIFPDHPVLWWCFSNIVMETDPADNIKISKKRSPEKVDLAVASVMALDGAVRNAAEKVEPSIMWM